MTGPSTRFLSPWRTTGSGAAPGRNPAVRGDFTAEAERGYRERLEQELTCISQMGFPGYLLIVADFINWAKDHGIPVGPGRGSAAGSLVAFAIRITDIDPMPYHLLFERFLNPERISMPDIDVDFCIYGREEVIEYVREKYGTGNVAQIITFGTMQAKGVIRDVGRALDMPYGEVDKIAKLVPGVLNITLKEALQQEPKLRELVEKDPKVKELFHIALALEGLTRHASTHAAGVVVTPEASARVSPALYRSQVGRPGHPVRHELRGEDRPGQVRLPRAENPHRHRQRGAADPPGQGPRISICG